MHAKIFFFLHFAIVFSIHVQFSKRFFERLPLISVTVKMRTSALEKFSPFCKVRTQATLRGYAQQDDIKERIINKKEKQNITEKQRK